ASNNGEAPWASRRGETDPPLGFRSSIPHQRPQVNHARPVVGPVVACCACRDQRTAVRGEEQTVYASLHQRDGAYLLACGRFPQGERPGAVAREATQILLSCTIG